MDNVNKASCQSICLSMASCHVASRAINCSNTKEKYDINTLSCHYYNTIIYNVNWQTESHSLFVIKYAGVFSLENLFKIVDGSSFFLNTFPPYVCRHISPGHPLACAIRIMSLHSVWILNKTHKYKFLVILNIYLLDSHYN